MQNLKKSTQPLTIIFSQFFVPKSVAGKWTNSEQIGIEALQLIEDQKHLRILIKKDFACLEKGTGEDDSDAFPHPLEDREC